MRRREAIADVRVTRDVPLTDAPARLQVGQVVDTVRVLAQTLHPGPPRARGPLRHTLQLVRPPVRGQGGDAGVVALPAAVVLLVIAAAGQVTVLLVTDGPPRRGPPYPLLAGDAPGAAGVRVAARVGAVADGRVSDVGAAGVGAAIGVGAAGAPRRAGARAAAAADAAALQGRVRVAVPRQVPPSVDPHRVGRVLHPLRRAKLPAPPPVP